MKPKPISTYIKITKIMKMIRQLMKTINILLIILLFFNLISCNTAKLKNTYVNDTIPLKIPIIDEHILNQSMDLTWEIKYTHPYLGWELPSCAILLKNGSKIENIENKTTITANDKLSFRTNKTGRYDINLKVKNNNQLILHDKITLKITYTPAVAYERKRNFMALHCQKYFIIISLFALFILVVIIETVKTIINRIKDQS